MRIGLLGGVFNPPHLGHLLMAQQALDLAGFQEIWLLPAYRHTFVKQLDSLTDRLHMTKLLAGDRIRLSTLEIDQRLSGQTIELVPLLQNDYPQHQFTFIIGSDQLPTFHKWGEYQKLLQKLPFLVIPRAGFPTKPLYKGMRVLEHPLLIKTNISSSIIRQRVRQGLTIEYLVPGKVKEYIEKKGLYK